jgi:TRAP-type C4-dicarboxylate transport system permease small subunit
MLFLLHWLRARAGDLTSVMLGLMFLSFLAQILFRYVLNLPLDWTLELCLTLWLWTVFWGATFLVEEVDHVRFDVFYQSRRPATRRALALVSSVAIMAAFAASLPATYSYVSFYRIKPSVTLGWRLDIVFSVYLFFAVGVILQSALRCYRILSGRPFEARSFYEGARGVGETNGR